MSETKLTPEPLSEEASYVFNSILQQLGGLENLSAVGVEAGSIKPVSIHREEYGGYEVHGLSFVAFDGKEVEIVLELSDLYSISVNGKPIKEDLYFDDLIYQVEQEIGAVMPYLIEPETRCYGNQVTIGFRRVPNPMFVG